MKNLYTPKMIAAQLMLMLAPVANAQFYHPGCLHTQADFDRINKQIEDGSNPQVTKAWNTFAANWMLEKHDNWLSAIQGNTIIRGEGAQNFAHSERDFGMCYIKAIYWKLMHNSPNASERQLAETRAKEAVDLLNQYAKRITGIGGNSNYALVGALQGWQVANAAEILREYDGWPENEQKIFRQWVYDVWYTSIYDFTYRQNGQSDPHYHSNWNGGAYNSMMAIGIYLDDPFIYNQAMQYLKQSNTNASLKEGLCGNEALNGINQGYLVHFFDVDSLNESLASKGINVKYHSPIKYLCQNQESGRDQPHAEVAMGQMTQACEQAWNQGDDLWDFNGQIMAGGIEYLAGFNSADDNDSIFMKNYPAKDWWITCTVCGNSNYTSGVSYSGRTPNTNIWYIGYNHFANRMGLYMPYAKKAWEKAASSWSGGCEWGAGANAWQNYSDNAGFGDLMHNEDSLTTPYTRLRGTLKMVSGMAEGARLTQVSGSSVPAVSQGMTYNFPELNNIKRGSVILLQPQIVDGSEDTGNWEWEDDPTIKTREREVTMDHSKILRAIYTNAAGVKSKQLFTLHVDGEGFCGTVVPYMIYNGTQIDNDTVIYVRKNEAITLGITYTGPMKSIKWEKYNSTLNKWLNDSESGASLKTPALTKNTLYRVTFSNHAGVEKIFTFNIGVTEVDASIYDGEEWRDVSALSVEKGSEIKIGATPNSILGKSEKYTRHYVWTCGEDTLQTSVRAGKELSDTLTATVDSTMDLKLTFTRVKNETGEEYKETTSFKIYAYEENTLEPGDYYIVDPETGLYMENSNAQFTEYDEASDEDFLWDIRQFSAYGNRYIIYVKGKTNHFDTSGKLTTRFDYMRQSINIRKLAGSDNLYAFKNSNDAQTCQNMYWNIAANENGMLMPTVNADNTDSEYPFMILDKETMVGIDDVETGTAAEPVSKSYYSLNGMKLEAPCKGITIVKTIMSDGTVKTEKIFTK